MKTKFHIPSKVLLFASFLLAIFLIAIMNFTTPMGVGTLGVLVFFTIIYFMFATLATVACRGFFMMKASKASEKNEVYRKSRKYASILALAPLMLLIAQSFGHLRILEGVIVLVITGVLIFMSAKGVFWLRS